MTLAGIAALITQTPAGALVDSTRFKRSLIAIAALVVTASCLLLPFVTSFSLVAVTQAISAVAASIFAPAICAITLGITGPRAFTRRTGRNETFNHAGNACAALLAGLSAYLFGPVAVFYLMAVMALASVIAVSFVSADAIDHDLARGLEPSETGQGKQPSGFSVLLTNRPLLMFAICCALFHLANAAMLPLVSQKLAQANLQMATPLTSACMVGALFPVVVKDLTLGTGHFNVSLGAISTVFGLGAALSNSLAGIVVQEAGYSAGFLTLAAVALVALVLLWVAVPETVSGSNADSMALQSKAPPMVTP
jgi:predicted MFS family arabinose efflux permease